LKPENACQTEVGRQPPTPAKMWRRNNYVRSLELNSNVFSRLARSTYLSKIRANPHWAAAFGYSGQRHVCLGPSSSKPFKHTTRFFALSTRISLRQRRAPRSTFIGSQRVICRCSFLFQAGTKRSLQAPRHESAHKGTGAFNLIKELLLEVLRYPLTCRRTLSPTSSPVAGAATLRLQS